MAQASPLEAQSLARLSEWLRENHPQFGTLRSVEKFVGGQSNPTYRLLCSAGSCVLRRRPFGHLLPKAHMIEREYVVMSALHKASVPVPRMFGYCKDEAVIGAQFYLMEYLEGRIFWDASLPGHSAPERASLYDAMNAVVANLHSIDPKSVGLEAYGRPTGFMARQVRLWTEQYRAAQTQEIGSMNELIGWLPAHLPPDPPQARVVHGDLRLDNLMFHPTEPRVIAILDWELSTIGDPNADLAYHMIGWHMPPQLLRGLEGLDLPALGIPTEQDYLHAYLERRHADLPESWNFYRAFSFFKLASIAQGVAKRASDGNASAADAASVGARAPAIADIGWRIATRDK